MPKQITSNSVTIYNALCYVCVFVSRFYSVTCVQARDTSSHNSHTWHTFHCSCNAVQCIIQCKQNKKDNIELYEVINSGQMLFLSLILAGLKPFSNVICD